MILLMILIMVLIDSDEMIMNNEINGNIINISNIIMM